MESGTVHDPKHLSDYVPIKDDLSIRPALPHYSHWATILLVKTKAGVARLLKTRALRWIHKLLATRKQSESNAHRWVLAIIIGEWSHHSFDDKTNHYKKATNLLKAKTLVDKG
jgi:hypothetical protein